MHGYSEVKLTQLRRELHRYPDLSGEEVQTAIRINRFIASHPPDRHLTGMNGNGIIALYEGKEPGLKMMVRCEMDALPIEETNSFNYRSTRKGIAHQCGHDGHMAILCGLASSLSARRPEKGSVAILFQPAEETGAGAVGFLHEQRFQDLMPDYIFALHNLPGYRKGEIIIREGDFTASVNSIIIRLKGRKAHAAEPMRGNNPANAVAEIIETLRKAENRDPMHPDFSLLTPVHIHMGNIAYGVSADHADLHYTLRARSDEQLRKLEHFTEEQVQGIAATHKLEIQLEWTQRFVATVNHPAAVAWIRDAAMEQNLRIHETITPFGWGEDFGFFTEKIPGALFGLGAGTDLPSLHQPDYDFPDDIIGTGVDMLKSLVKAVLSSQP